jgi:hypothetical protein
VVILVLADVASAAAISLFSRQSDGSEARAAYLQECQARVDSTACAERAEQHHAACFVATYSARTKSSEKHFDRAGYVECVDRGHAAWLELKRERAREREQRKDLYAE